MRHSLFGGIVAAALLGLAASSAAAQETGTPVFRAPYRDFTNYEFGASLSDPGEGINVAVEGFYHYATGPHDIGFRAGFADPKGNGNTIFLVGADFRTRVLKYSESFPLDGALTLGLGTTVSDFDDAWTLPVGISLGRRFELEGSKTTFTPFVHPVLAPVFGSGDDDVNFTLGLGVDIRFTQQLAVRVSGGLGDLDGVGVSLAYIH